MLCKLDGSCFHFVFQESWGLKDNAGVGRDFGFRSFNGSEEEAVLGDPQGKA
jgi:hypothetical protein